MSTGHATNTIGRTPAGTAGDAAGPDPHVAAVMFPLDSDEAAVLAAVLGDGWVVRPGHDAGRAAAVLLRPCSRQTEDAVHRRFPGAHLVVVDPLLDVARFATPIRRALGAGVDLYLTEELAWAA